MRLIFSLLVLVPLICQGQFRHMHYNLTLYGNPFGCDENSNNTNEKDAALSEIIAYAQPDIFAVNELADQNVWANRILNDVLNANENLWERAALSNSVTFSSILNGLFYRADKFELASQEVVYQDLDGGFLLRPIDFYHLYAIDDGLLSGDTTFLTCVVAHLAASDSEEREDQTEAAMAKIQELGPANYIFSGDLNIDAAWEEAFQTLISEPDPSIRLYDPISISNNWNNNPSIADYHTQSTRFSDTNAGCFSGGGLDDRFDITLVSSSILSGSQGITYVEGSYQALGQNGNDYNQELQTFNNGAVPDPIAQALYDMSDHLPVITDFETESILSIDENGHAPLIQLKFTSDGLYTTVAGEMSHSAELIDFSGRRVAMGSPVSPISQFISNPSPGIYLLLLEGDRWRQMRKVYLN